MLVYAVALAQALAYLGAVPLYLALRLRAGDGFKWGVGFSAFERRFALRNLKPRAAKKRGAKIKPRLAWDFARRLRVERVSVRGRLSLGDAAATAMACGALRALSGGLRAGGTVAVDVAPDFDAAAPRAELQGMVRVRSGQVIIAAARCGLDYANGRIAQWKSTRSKT